MGESLLILDSVKTEQDMKQGERYTSVVRKSMIPHCYQHEQGIKKVACS